MPPSGDPTWPLRELISTSPSVILLLITAGAAWQKFRQLQKDVAELWETTDEHATWIARAEGRNDAERRTTE